MRLIMAQAERRPAPADGLPVLLYRPRRSGTGSVGNPVRLDLRRWPHRTTQEALDLLSVALAATAGDRFVLRDEAADRWTREIGLVVPVADPERWLPIVPVLTEMLGFLSGDRWSIKVTDGGLTVDGLYDRRRVRARPRPAGDCVCLFSGGMDSFLGAADLVAEGRRPLLVSQYQPGEQSLQGRLRGALGQPAENHFATTPHPLPAGDGMDTQQRARSFLFVALAAAVGSASLRRRSDADRFDLFVPENGLIALNAPLSPARSGSCSTRTVHPRTLALMQEILNLAGVPAHIVNPYAGLTKGEIVSKVVDAFPGIAGHLAATVSCGAYRRNNYRQCGYCIPCLIRRAAFLEAGQTDHTAYKVPFPATTWRSEPKWRQAEHLAAVETALADRDAVLRRLRLTLKGVPVERWSALEEVYSRGLSEVGRVIGIL